MDRIPVASKGEPMKHHHYDLSMSKRTRRPQVVTICSLNQDNKLQSKTLSSMNHEDDAFMNINSIRPSSLHDKITATETDHDQGVDMEKKVEEKNGLALVPRKEGVVGVKKGGIVSRYVKVLRHLIKMKRGLN